MSWYRTGTIALTNGSNAVVGTGTDFISGTIAGECLVAPDGRIYEIAFVVSAGGLTLGGPYLGSTASGQAYTIAPTQSYLRDLASQAATLVNGFQAVKDGPGVGKFPDGTQIVPGIRFASDDNTGIRRVGADSFALVAGGVDQATVAPDGFTARVLRVWNAAGTFVGSFASAITAARTWTFPDKSGTVALTSDFAAPGPIGGTIPAAGAFTELSASSGSSSTAGVVSNGASTSQGAYQFGAQNAAYNIRGGADYLGVETNTAAGTSIWQKVGGAIVTAATSAGLNVFGRVLGIRDGQTEYHQAGLESRSSTGDVHIALHAMGASAASIKHTRGVQGIQIVGQDGASLAPLSAGPITSMGVSPYLSVIGQGGAFQAPNKFGVDHYNGNARIYSSGPDSSTNGGFEFRSTRSDGSGDVPAMTISPSGNLGLGVTPSAWSAVPHVRALDVLSSSISFEGSNAISSYTHYAYQTTGDNTTGWRFKQTGVRPFQYQMSNAQKMSWRIGNTGDVGTQVTWTDAMTLDVNGNLLVGVTTEAFHTLAKSNANNYAAAIRNTHATSPHGELINFSGVTGGTGVSFLDCSDDALRFRIAGTGNVININNSYGAISDIKYKENVVDTTPKLAKLMRVRIVNYTLKTDPTHKQIGVIAQELEEISPGLIEEAPDYAEVEVEPARTEVRTTQRQKVERHEDVRYETTLVDGQWRKLPITTTKAVPLFEDHPLFDEAGTAIMEVVKPEQPEARDKEGEVITPFKAAVYRQATHSVPVMGDVDEVVEVPAKVERQATGTVTKSVKYSVFVPMLIKAMQEQQALIDALAERITALEAA